MTDNIFLMRILHYLNYHSGGITRYAAEVLRAMPADMENHVLCPPGTELTVPVCSIYPTLVDQRRGGGFNGRLKFLWSQIENPFKMLQLLKHVRPDIVHFGNINHLSYQYWGPRLKALNIPFVVSVHDVRREKPIINGRWENKQLVSIYRAAAALLVHSNAQRDELAKFAGISRDKIVIVPHGPYEYPIMKEPCDIRKELGIPREAKVGLLFGGIRDDKGVDLLISAVVELPESHLIVAGRSASKLHKPVSFYRELAFRLGIESRIHFVDSYIPDETVADYFRAADWCGLVYHDSFSSQSGVLCSSVKYRTPLLVAGAPTLVETVQRFQIGVTAENRSAEALSAAITRLCELSKQENAFQFERFEEECSWTRNAETTCETYRRITLCIIPKY